MRPSEMTPRPLQRSQPAGLHVAILPDGNGRWAAARGLSRSEGHRAGVSTVRRIVKSAPSFGIGTLTLYGFSSDNWVRPTGEVSSLFLLLEDFFRREALAMNESGVRVTVIGRRDRLPTRLVRAMEDAEEKTQRGSALDLRIALDYSSRDAILRAACWMISSLEISQREFAKRLAEVTHAQGAIQDVDLLVRTGGEKRLSDFLLWECAYAELHFSPRMWPDFSAEDLAAAVTDFRARERRFGGLPKAVAG